MTEFFCINVEFLHGSFHGRGADGEPAWPPSPLRLFQALISAAAGHDNERRRVESAAPALKWLETQPAPRILAPRSRLAQPFRLYVPNNTGDLVAGAWSRGSDSSIAKYRTEKDVHSRQLCDSNIVHYLWKIPEDASARQHATSLFPIVRSISHLGWGIDMVAADAGLLSDDAAAELSGERFEPVDGRTGLDVPVPVPGTFDAVARRYAESLGRLSEQDGGNVFVPVTPLTTFRRAAYRTASQLQVPATASFALCPVERETNARFQAYDPVSQGAAVAGMIRHILADPKFHEQLGWNEDRLPFLHGHGESADGNRSHQPTSGPRLAILPLPSLEFRGEQRGNTVGPIRRVLLTVMRGEDTRALREVEALLGGRELIPESGTEKAMLQPLPQDQMVNSYTRQATTWATVTPVVLPGFDDPGGLRKRLRKNAEPKLTSAEKKKLIRKLDDRTEALLRKAIEHAGFYPELARYASLEWRGTGYLQGLSMARKYFVPDHLQRFRRVHVRVTWRDAAGQAISVPGPICIGGGRHFGLGLFIPSQNL